jgi:hypothetical protein
VHSRLVIRNVLATIRYENLVLAANGGLVERRHPVMRGKRAT